MIKISPKQMAQLLLELTRGKSEAEIQPILKEYVALLGKKRLINKTPEIIEMYRTLYNTEENIAEVTVTLISKLDSDTRTKLSGALKEKLGVSEVQMIEKVDERLLGGIKIQVKDTVHDMSLKNVLNQLEVKLTA